MKKMMTSLANVGIAVTTFPSRICMYSRKMTLATPATHRVEPTAPITFTTLPLGTASPLITVKLRGRAQAYPARSERKIAKRARSAPPQARHGPLQRLLAAAIKETRHAHNLATASIGKPTSVFNKCLKERSG